LLGEATREERAGGGRTVELQRRFGTLIPHGPPSNGSSPLPRRKPDRI
jgi:hypothetical protein